MLLIRNPNNKVNSMDKIKISIAKKTLKLLENKDWNKILLSDILSTQNNKSIKNKRQLLININRYFDFILKKNLSNLEESSSKDMLFEVLMARLDILNSHRKPIKKIIKYLLSNPNDFLAMLPSFIETMILISTLSNINVEGIKGVSKVKAIFILYVLIIYTWNKDETQTLEKTMTTLDNYLNNLDKFLKLI
tara:strand:- start:130 stop:705 length:576 start_codon:yes stop_codon:yes gene_type:complete